MNLYQISTNVPMYRITSITYAHIHTIPSESQIMGTICYRITKDGHETLYSWFSYVVPTRSNGRQRKLSCRSGSSGVGTLTFCRLVLQCTTLRRFGTLDKLKIVQSTSPSRTQSPALVKLFGLSTDISSSSQTQ